MSKLQKFSLIIILPLIVFFILFYFVNQDPVSESTTQHIEVISKGEASEERWIVLSNDKKIYVENLSIWALIEENKSYGISYDKMKKTGRYKLTTIVPGDYKGQF